jgi:hypothetical protein
VLIRAGLYSNCIRLMPPLVADDALYNEGLDVLEGAIAEQSQQALQARLMGKPKEAVGKA